MKVAVEIGGTFTDLVWLKANGAAAISKVPSTPQRIHRAVLNAVDAAGVDLKSLHHFIHGSTVATNALLTRNGGMTGLITTRGFRDVVAIGTHDRFGNIYSSFYEKPTVPIRRAFVREALERISAAGEVLVPLDEAAVVREIEALVASGVTSIAICLLHAYRNPVHEKALVELVRRHAPGVSVFASHEVSPEFREYERTVTTCVNAFVGPVVSRYVKDLRDELTARSCHAPLLLMQSNGGIMPAEAAAANAVRMLLSGPAAGVRAAVWFARRNAIDDIITLDMGGTSTDVAIAPNLEPRIVPQLMIDGLPIRTTSIDMVTVGAGGGSIAAIDNGGFLNVGPQSAGADPGPACYGRGGEWPTVTDAQLLSGLLRAERSLSGGMKLHTDKAQAAVRLIAEGKSEREAADSILRIVNSNMASAVRLVSTARGIDPKCYTMVAYGGGGPLHGAMVAQEVGIKRVLIPWSPGIASAIGLLVADLIVDLVVAKIGLLDDTALDRAAVEELTESCAALAKQIGVTLADCEIEFGLDLRYAGQGFELTLWTGREPRDAAAIRALFEEAHRRSFGYARTSLPIQVVNLRARIVQRNRHDVVTPVAAPATRERANGTVMINGKPTPTLFMERGALAIGERLAGPVVLEELTSTVFVPPDWMVECLPTGDLLLQAQS